MSFRFYQNFSFKHFVTDYLADMFKSRSQVHNRQTRSSGALDIPLCRLSTGQRSFAFRGAKLWNSLNDNIKSLKCPRNFRRHLANVLLSWYIFCNYNIIVLTFLINLYKFVFFILLSWKAHLGSINKVYVCMYVCMYFASPCTFAFLKFPLQNKNSDDPMGCSKTENPKKCLGASQVFE